MTTPDQNSIVTTGYVQVDCSSRPLTVILLTGFARTGKDTAAKLIAEQFAAKGVNAKIRWFANPLKEEFIAALQRLLQRAGASLDVIQQAETLVRTDDTELKKRSRPGLVSMGTGCGRFLMEDLHVSIAAQEVKADMWNTGTVIFPDARFANEYTDTKAKLPAHTKFVRLWIERPGVGPANDDELKYTAPLKDEMPVVLNDGSLEVLRERLVCALRVQGVQL